MTSLTRGYRSYVLGLLVAGYLLDSLDRSILGVLMEPIKGEFGLSDIELGLLGGLAFAVLYSTSGLVMGVWADRTRPNKILVLSMLMWSLMTVLCGAAASFALLLLARMGTAVGESGANPASQSILASLFPAPQRATAFGIFALGAPAGAMLGSALGGLGNSLFGWRATLVAAGTPGLVLAAVLYLTTSKPLRIARHEPDEAAPRIRTTSKALRVLASRGSFRHLCLACAIHSMAIYAAASFNAPFLMRQGWNSTRVGSLMALNGAFGILGALLGGALADRLGRRRPERCWMLRIAALASLALVPIELYMYLIGSTAAIIVGFVLTGFFSSVFFGPSFAATQNLAGSGLRATAASTLIFVKTLIGMGVGPLLVGALSDQLRPSVGADSLRLALLATAFFNLWSFVHFWISARLYPGDMADSGASPGGVIMLPRSSIAKSASSHAGLTNWT